MYSAIEDIKPAYLADIAEDRLVRVYPYELINASKDLAFIQQNTTTIASISQNLLDTEDDTLLTDETGAKYFEMFPDVTSNTILDITSATSVFGKELKEEQMFSGLANWYYEAEFKQIKNGNFNFIPAVCTIGRPLNEKDYEDGKQPVYIINSVIEAKEADLANKYEMNPEGLYEFTLENITSIEASYPDSSVIFTFDDFNRPIDNITIGLENHTLLNHIKAKGDTSIKNQPDSREFGDIDLTTNHSLCPFKFTPIAAQDKIEMFADWFDYDTVMPWVFAEKYKRPSKLVDIIKNTADLELVLDMLAVSASFASNWTNAPVITSGSETGKIKPDFRIGTKGIKVITIADKDPVKVIDGIYEAHIRREPNFMDDKTRYQVVRMVLNALSRYIYSSYCIGKGQNAYNEAYLPWYLKPMSDLIPKSIRSVTNPDAGVTGSVNTFVLDDLNFQIKSTYFNQTFDNVGLVKSSDLLLPTKVNLSNTKLLQTDRKLTLPQIPDVIGAMMKLPLPGDINTMSSNDLSYIFYLPIEDSATFERLFINSTSAVSATPAGTRINVILNNRARGWTSGSYVLGLPVTQAEANAEVLREQPGIIIQQPVLTRQQEVEISIKYAEVGILGGAETTITIQAYGGTRFDNLPLPNTFKVSGRLSRDEVADQVLNKLQFTAARITERSIENYNAVTGGYEFDLIIYKWVAGQAIVETLAPSTVTTYSIANRQVIFDKQDWKRFLTSYGIIPNGSVSYVLTESGNIEINSVKEIIIGSLWGNYIDIKLGNTLPIRVPLINKDDESVAVQRLLFS